MMAESRRISVECGFCLRKEEELPEPRTLPCNHTHCLQCLTGFYEENNVLVCPADQCGEVFDALPNTLPSLDVLGKDKKLCDACVSKRLAKQLAVIYCPVCCKKFCAKHQESHDDALGDHPSIGMQEYAAEAMKKQIKNCKKHEDQPYIMGCKHCRQLACLKCLADLDKCVDGAPHSLLSLDDLIASLMKEDISRDMISKENQYEKLFKKTSKARAAYDKKTSEMIQLIHQTRDAQVNALKLKYEKLEDEVMKKRQKSRVDMAEFMEDIVLKKWTRLRNQRQLIESRVKNGHQVDIVKGLQDLKNEIQKFVGEEMPKLQLKDEVELKKLDVNREMELKMIHSDGIAIDSEHGLTTLLANTMSSSARPSPRAPLSSCIIKLSGVRKTSDPSTFFDGPPSSSQKKSSAAQQLSPATGFSLAPSLPSQKKSSASQQPSPATGFSLEPSLPSQKKSSASQQPSPATGFSLEPSLPSQKKSSASQQPSPATGFSLAPSLPSQKKSSASQQPSPATGFSSAPSLPSQKMSSASQQPSPATGFSPAPSLPSQKMSSASQQPSPATGFSLAPSLPSQKKSSASRQPSPATGFSFAPSLPSQKKSSASQQPSPATGFSLAPSSSQTKSSSSNNQASSSPELSDWNAIFSRYLRTQNKP